MAKYLFRTDSRIESEVQKKLKELLPIASAEIQKQADERANNQILKASEFYAHRAVGLARTDIYNSNINPDRKPDTGIPFSVMRAMSINYPIARACIDRRIRQMTQLSWDIVAKEGKTVSESRLREVRAFFKRPFGQRSRFSEFLSILIDDLLTIDAISFEYRRTVGGRMLNILPVDPATIVLRLNEDGTTPEPPDPAYAQFIFGSKIAEFTTDELLYDFLNRRSYSPYGLAPMESLIIQVSSAISGALYNNSWYQDGNVPEGFVTLPEEIASNVDQVREWQVWWDAILSGNIKEMRKLRFIPGGSEYIATKKPEDMSFEKFEMWLLQQTCAMFDVQPQDIGITYQVNKATGETQTEIAKEKGLRPVANFCKEIFDDIIENEFLTEDIEFSWVNIDPVNRKEEAEIAKIEIEAGALSIDEYRKDHGKKELGMGAYIKTGQGIVMIDDIVSGKYQQRLDQATESKKEDPEEPKEDAKTPELDEEKAEQMELKKWRKCIIKDLENGKPLRTKFPSDLINKSVKEEIQEALKGVHTRGQAKLLFDMYLDPELRASNRLLKAAAEMREIEDAAST